MEKAPTTRPFQKVLVANKKIVIELEDFDFGQEQGSRFISTMDIERNEVVKPIVVHEQMSNQCSGDFQSTEIGSDSDCYL